MLMGERAVLHGKHALVCTVDRRLAVTLTPPGRMTGCVLHRCWAMIIVACKIIAS